MNTNVHENTDSEAITPLNKRRILPVFLLVGLFAASTAAVMSVLPFYIREMGGSPLIIGIIIATEAFSQFCAAPLIGHLSDRVGRKRILIVTLAIAAIVYYYSPARNVSCLSCSPVRFLALAPGIYQPPQPILPIIRTSEIGVRQLVSSQAALA